MLGHAVLPGPARSEMLAPAINGQWKIPSSRGERIRVTIEGPCRPECMVNCYGVLIKVSVAWEPWSTLVPPPREDLEEDVVTIRRQKTQISD